MPRCCGSFRQPRLAIEHVALLDDVAQLADVARPVVLAEFAEPLGRGLPPRPLILGRKLLGEELDEMRNVFDAMPQRRHAQLDHVQAIEQILAEAAFGHFRFELAVRGRDDLHVDLLRNRRADRRDFVLLQHAQQLRLQIDRHLADFVEKDDAARGRAEHAQAASGRAGKRALLVTEQLAFGQGGGERGAVDGDERLVAARTEPMQQSGPDFFTGTGFAGDKNGATDIGGALDMARNAADLGIRAQDPAVRLFGSQPQQGFNRRSDVCLCHVLLCADTLTIRIAESFAAGILAAVCRFHTTRAHIVRVRIFSWSISRASHPGVLTRIFPAARSLVPASAGPQVSL